MNAAALNSHSLLHFNETMQLEKPAVSSRHSSEKSTDKSDSSKSSSPLVETPGEVKPKRKKDTYPPDKVLELVGSLEPLTEKNLTSRPEETNIKVRTEDKKVQTFVENKNVQAQTDNTNAKVRTSNKNIQTKKPCAPTSFTDRVEQIKEEMKKNENKSTLPIGENPKSTEKSNQITFGHAIVEFFKVSAELDEATSKCILYFLTSIVSQK
jgi:hypothetical protein